MEFLAPYRKAVVAIVGAAAATLPLFGVTALESAELQAAIVSVVTATLVYFIPNRTA